MLVSRGCFWAKKGVLRNILTRNILTITSSGPCTIETSVGKAPASQKGHVIECTDNDDSLTAEHHETTIRVPYFKSILLNQKSESLSVLKSIENRLVVIESLGPIRLESVGSIELKITTRSDLISRNGLKGDLIARIEGNIDVDIIHSKRVSIDFCGQKTFFGAIFAESFQLTAANRKETPLDLFLKNFHGFADVKLQGNANLNIGSLEGKGAVIRQERGDLKIKLSNLCDSLDIEVGRGKVELMLPALEPAQYDELDAKLCLEACNINVDEEVSRHLRNVSSTPRKINGVFGRGDKRNYRVSVKEGQVVVRISSWIASMLAN